MYLFSRVSNFANSAFRTNSRVLIFAYFERGLSPESAEKRILKIGLIEPEKNAFKVCPSYPRFCSFLLLIDLILQVFATPTSTTEDSVCS